MLSNELLNFLSSNWRNCSSEKQEIKENQNAKLCKNRRNKIRKLLNGKTLLVPYRDLQRYDNKQLPSGNFIYFTGLTFDVESDSALVIGPNNDTLYIKEPHTSGSKEFFTDAEHGEFWVGPSDSIEIIQKKTGIQTKSFNEFKKLNKKAFLLSKNKSVLEKIISLRIKKDVQEINEIERAIKYTKSAFENVFRTLNFAKNERELEVAFDFVAKTYGNGVGYSTIIGSGENATYLHWSKNNAKLRKSDLVLIDAGVQTNQLYTADITRSFPMNGTFSGVQKEVYNAVLEANCECIDKANKGTSWNTVHNTAAYVLSKYLKAWGIFSESVDLIVKKGLYKRFMIHGIGHSLGLDVHDTPDNLLQKYGAKMVLENNMVMTIEPGLYFHTNDSLIPNEFKGIGVRIEDNIVINDKQAIVLSRKIPKDVLSVEKWIKKYLKT
jgi:Xaa-Pro aminopeptidase